MNREAERALGGRHDVRIERFPFKVGRESRSLASATSQYTELRLGTLPELNDLYLLEPAWADILEISREHFAIDSEEGRFWLTDRGSACGTVVAGTQVGGNRAGSRIELRSGDVIIVGSASSEYAFRFETG